MLWKMKNPFYICYEKIPQKYFSREHTKQNLWKNKSIEDTYSLNLDFVAKKTKFLLRYFNDFNSLQLDFL